MTTAGETITVEAIRRRIREVRGQRVVLDFDVAFLYDVQAKALHQAVTRNSRRFPPDFMFQLSMEEFSSLRAQFVSSRWGSLRRRPFAFTERGLLMLASILRSARATQVGLELMRAFVATRAVVLEQPETASRLSAIDPTPEAPAHVVFETLRQLMDPTPLVAPAAAATPRALEPTRRHELFLRRAATPPGFRRGE
jgi:hypothetical protein